MRLVQGRKGQGTIEYILIVAAVVLLIVALLKIVQPGAQNKMAQIQQGMQ